MHTHPAPPRPARPYLRSKHSSRKPRMVTAPPELLVLPAGATLGDLRRAAAEAFRRIYRAFTHFQVRGGGCLWVRLGRTGKREDCLWVVQCGRRDMGVLGLGWLQSWPGGARPWQGAGLGTAGFCFWQYTCASAVR